MIERTTITVQREPMGEGFQAYINGDKRRWGRGNNVDQAIADVIRTHADEIGIKITINVEDGLPTGNN